MDLCLAIELSPQDAALRAHRARGDVHINALHRRQIDHQTLVDRRAAGDVVTAAAHGHLEAQRVGQAHGVDDVGDAMAAGDGGRMLVDQPVVDPAAVVVGVIGWPQQLASERRRGERNRFSNR